MKLFALVLVWATGFVYSDFVYKDFNDTTGLVYNGAAGTTRCWDDPLYKYGDVQGNADVFNIDVITQRRETTDLIYEFSTETSEEKYNEEIESSLAGFIHRSDTKSAPKNCKVRTRLTPSNPSTVGSLWYRDNVPVTHGFDTYFTFQITDHSKECSLVKDQYLSQMSYRTCSVHGADGFAFVIQNAPNTTKSLGQLGGQLGFGGIPNSLAIAFDTWQNPGEDSLGVDHVSVQSQGVDPNDGLESGLFGFPKSHPLADGEIHVARIAYFNDLQIKYFDKLVASDSMVKYLKDNGEGKRVGTLVVFLDDGIEKDVPLLSLPINLSLLLHMPIDTAYVGFTSSTGRFYEKHDILSWYWCNKQPCDEPDKAQFDYHQQSRFSTAKKQSFTPGPGFGGSGDTSGGFPIKNTNPDTTAWEMPLQHFASGRSHGLSADSSVQVPPATLY